MSPDFENWFRKASISFVLAIIAGMVIFANTISASMGTVVHLERTMYAISTLFFIGSVFFMGQGVSSISEDPRPSNECFAFQVYTMLGGAFFTLIAILLPL